MCSKCNKKYLRKYDFNRHLKSCGQNVECAVCGKMFAGKDNLKEHLKNMHSETDKMTPVYTVRTQTFKFRSTYNSHIGVWIRKDNNLSV